MEQILAGIIGLLIVFSLMAVIHYREENKQLQRENEDLMWECIDLREERDSWKQQAEAEKTKLVPAMPQGNRWEKVHNPWASDENREGRV